MDLFEKPGDAPPQGTQPLAARMRPASVEEIAGQEHVLGPGKLLRRAIDADRLGSIILYGPPGCGKTSLAEVIAAATERRFVRTSGVLANVAELRALIKDARHRLKQDGTETILFVDEIHRFNKAQQDVLLPHVEDGAITLIGATTHNPMFFINTPLTSRSLVFQLNPLSEEAVVSLLRRALSDPRGLAAHSVVADDDALLHMARMCEGDARRALNALEIAVLTTHPDDAGMIHVDQGVAEDSVQKKAILYDNNEDGHYDTISAFIKSVRGSDPHAAVYWLAKMLYAGEDPRFVARRLVILASEDIGNADPRGLSIATAAMQAVEFVGMPEARITLAQATTYLATAPKSNAAYEAIGKALKDVESGRVLPVPEHLKNKHLNTAEGKEPTKGYAYPHAFKGNHVNQEYIPTSAVYYEPSEEGYEQTIKTRMLNWAGAAAS
ncbi:MAG: replication-associated recombination protein A [Verrucomicrobia bacterium]|nr:replication-associated recombination protein A [Verrucomicrobiota bacterium]